MPTAKTHEAMLPQFDYFAPEYVQRSIEKTYYEKITPVKIPARGGPLEFKLAKSSDYTSLHDTKLELTVKVTKAKGTAAADHATDKVMVANNVLHTIFEKLEVEIDGNKKEECTMYPYRAYLDTITSHRHDALDVRGSLQGWKKDTAGKFAVVEYVGTAGGIITRTEPFVSSNEITLMGQLHGDLMAQELCIPPDMEMLIRLTPSDSDFALLAAADAKYEVHITGAKLWVARVTTNPSLTAVHEKLFKGMNPVFSMRQVALKAFQLNAGIKETTLTNIFENNLPDRFLVGFLSNGSLTGAIDANPFFFQTFGVTFLQATVGSTKIPNDPYEPKFATGEYIREYLALLEEFNADEGDTTIDISKEEFKDGYTLFPFRVVPRSRGGDILGPAACVAGGLSLKLRFASALTDVVNVLVYYESRGKVDLKSKPSTSATK